MYPLKLRLQAEGGKMEYRAGQEEASGKYSGCRRFTETGEKDRDVKNRWGWQLKDSRGQGVTRWAVCSLEYLGDAQASSEQGQTEHKGLCTSRKCGWFLLLCICPARHAVRGFCPLSKEYTRYRSLWVSVRGSESQKLAKLTYLWFYGLQNTFLYMTSLFLWGM